MEQDESIEFYQIKLMEKERQLSELEAKVKKLEFKHSRDLKEMKIAEQRAKELLKQEKAKVDSFARQTLQQQEQNALLQRRANEIKADKDKQIHSLRAQYNQIKDEVRSYERILPTHTFLTQIQSTFSQLPTFQELFINCRESALQQNQLQSLVQTLKKNLQLQRKQTENEQESRRTQTHQYQTKINAFLIKLQQNDNQMNVKKKQLLQCQETIENLTEKQQQLQMLLDALKNNFQQFSDQQKEIQRNLREQLLQKEEALRVLTIEQVEKHESQIQTLKSNFEQKEQAYCRQIHNLERELTHVSDQLQGEKQKFQQNYKQINEVISSMQKKIDQQYMKFQDLVQDKDKSLHKYNQIQHLNEQLLQQISKLKKEISLNKEDQTQEILLKQTIDKLQSQREQMKEQLIRKEEELQRKQHDCRKLTEVNSMMKNQSQQIKSKMHGEFLPYDIEGLTAKRSSKRESLGIEPQIDVSQKQNPELVLQEEIQTLNIELGRVRKLYGDALLHEQKLNQQIKSLKAYYEEQIIIQRRNANENKSLLNEEKNKSYESVLTVQINKLNKRIQIIEQEKQSCNRLLQSKKQQIIQYKAQLKQLRNQIKKCQKQISQTKSNQLIFKNLHTQQIKQLKNKYSIITVQLQKSKQEVTLLQKKNKSQVQTILSQKDMLLNAITRLQNQLQVSQEQRQNLEHIVKELRNISREQEETIGELKNQSSQLYRKLQLQKDALDRQRNERALQSVASLQSLHSELQTIQDQNFQNQYIIAGEKEGEIYSLNRQVNDLKEQLEQEKNKYQVLRESNEIQINDYIQQLISIKIKVAETDLRVSEKQYLYNQYKKKHTS